MINYKKWTIKLKDTEKKFPVEVLNVRDLTELEIIGGEFTYITPDISLLENLTKLSIVSSKIAEIPNEIFLLPNLKYLSLKNNRIKKIELLDKNSTIETLILNKNFIEDTRFLNAFPELTNLDLGHNCILEISPIIRKCQSLMRINLEENFLRDLPLEFKELTNLIHLSIEKNKFDQKTKDRLNQFFKTNQF